VLLDGAVVGAGAVVRDSVLGRSARVGERTLLVGAVLGDRAVVGADNELLTGARVWTDAVLPDASVRFSSDEVSA
jgi:mannose-1-phosphate guanylyltransferase